MYHTHSVMYNVEDVIMESDGTHTKIIAEYGIDDNRISVTGEVYYERQDNDGPFFSSEPDEIGQVHDHIAKAFPWLRPLIDLQLVSVDTGAPIYALDNGWYWLRGHPRYAGEYLHQGRAQQSHRNNSGPCLETASRRNSQTLQPTHQDPPQQGS